jgi:hypothetical protein
MNHIQECSLFSGKKWIVSFMKNNQLMLGRNIMDVDQVNCKTNKHIAWGGGGKTEIIVGGKYSHFFAFNG